MDPIIGEIKLFVGDFAPVGWLFCDGQRLPVQQYMALYSIIGTTYGGDNQYFNLPDLRGRFAMQPGQGMDLTPHRLGEKGGAEAVTPKGVATTVAGTTANVASNQPQSNLPPYLCINYIIATTGIYPERP